MRPILRRSAFFAVALLVLALPASVVAFELTNCTLDLTSVDANDATIDAATAGGDDSTQANPFEVDWDGTVAWTGATGTKAIKDHSWSVAVFNIPTPLSGKGANEEGSTQGDGTVDVGVNLPFRVTGLFFVSGTFSGTGGECTGSGWMRLRGDPFGTIGFWVGAVLLLLGLLGLWTGFRRSSIVAVVGGFFLGLGAAAMLIIYAAMPVGEWTPLSAVGAGLVLGIVVGVMRPSSTPATG
jgi:hypothetical protein